MNTDTPETSAIAASIDPSVLEHDAYATMTMHAIKMERQRDEAHKLIRRLGTPKAFMDLEGVRIICADYMARWREGEAATPNVQTVEERLLTMCNYHHKITKNDKDFLAILSEKVEGITIDTTHQRAMEQIRMMMPDIAELICAAPRMLEALQIAKTEFEARDGAGTCPLEIEELLEELSQHNAK